MVKGFFPARIQLLFSTRISRSAPALALEIVVLMSRKKMKVCNSPRTKGAHFPKQMFRRFPYFFRRFPYFSCQCPCISRRFPCISGFCILAENTANSQKRQGSCHTLLHSNWRRMAWNGISMTGHVNGKLCSCASRCTTNAHSLLKAISVKFPQKCALTFFACMLFGGSGIPRKVPGSKWGSGCGGATRCSKVRNRSQSVRSARLCRSGRLNTRFVRLGCRSCAPT